MTSPAHDPAEEAHDEAAAAWLVERDEGFTPDRAAQFAAWCRDPDHAAALRRVERTLELFGDLPAVRADLEERIAPMDAQVSARPRAGRAAWGRWMAWGVAAVVCLGFVAVPWRERSEPPSVEHYATDGSVQRSLALADGSLVDLNVNSEVVVAFSAAERRLVLERGQAHFQVAHDSERPFVVRAGGVTVRAVGTAFGVRLTSKDVDVVVVEGKVELGSVENRPAAVPDRPPPRLVAGERTQVSHAVAISAPRIEAVDAATMRDLLAWQTSMVSFTDVPLRDVVTRLNRHGGLQLDVADESLATRKIGGRIALDQIEAFVRLLEHDGDIVADRSTPGRIVLHRAP